MTWIERTARQKSIGQVVLFLVVTAIVIWIYAENASYWRVFLFGPPPGGAAQLDAAATATDSYKPVATPYLTVTGGKVLSTGVQEVTTYEGFIHHVSAGYYAMLVGDRVLIVKSGKTPETTVGGELGAMPLDLKTELFPEGTDPVVIAQVYPLLLNTNYRESGWVGIFWGVLAEAIFGFFAWRSWMRLTGHVDHPAVKRARAWGNLEVTSANVERDLQTAVKAKSKGWTLTQDYAVKRKLLSFDLFRLENLVWAHKKAVKRRVYYIIPAGTGYAAMLCFSDGNAEIDGKQKKVDELLTLAGERAPWAAKGYSDELQRAYGKSKDGFVAEVMKRKREMGR
jgi:hypothetical protein